MNADSYYEPDEPTIAEVFEQANQDADSLVAEWAAFGEWETWIEVHSTRDHQPFFELQRVAHDGLALYECGALPGKQFDTIEEMRAFMVRDYPLLPQ